MHLTYSEPLPKTQRYQLDQNSIEKMLEIFFGTHLY